MSPRLPDGPSALRRTLRTLPVLLVALVAADCARNPATGERELSLVGEGQEIEMGRQADQQIVQSIGVYDEPRLQAYVEELGLALAAVSERPDLPWTFRVLDDPTPNAFALPGGFVYVTRGILSHMDTEAELAGVLGHEIGHITARHSVSQISRAQLTQLGVGLGMILVPELQPLSGLADVGLQLLFLKYGREDENQADRLGVRYMTALDYNPYELADVMAMLERASELQQGSGRVPEWLATHPEPGNRAENIVAIADELALQPASLVVRREAYLARIDGIVFGSDPREGYFSEGVFYHPELRFRLSFPPGWQTANTKQAVQAVESGQQAAVLLTLAQGSPAQALQQFAGQQGLQVGRASEQRVNGLPAVIAPFQAATEQTTLQGLVMFVAHRGTTYRLLGYGPAGTWSRFDDVVERSLASFAPVSDPAVLAVQPQRLDLVQLDRALSFDEFVQRYPSTVRPEVVAVINQLRPPATLPAGLLAKRVVEGS